MPLHFTRCPQFEGEDGYEWCGCLAVFVLFTVVVVALSYSCTKRRTDARNAVSDLPRPAAHRRN